jgi:thioredoxin 2
LAASKPCEAIMSSTPIHLVCPHCSKTNRLPADRLDDGPKCGHCGHSLFTGTPLELSASTFDQHLARNDVPLVVDFWAPWCAPCRTMAPAFASVTAQIEPAARFAKLDTEAEPTLAARHAIRSIPTLAIFKGGREIARQSGAVDTARLREWVTRHL